MSTQTLEQVLCTYAHICYIELIIHNEKNIYRQVLINSNKFSASGGSWNPGTSTVFQEGVISTGH